MSRGNGMGLIVLTGMYVAIGVGRIGSPRR